MLYSKYVESRLFISSLRAMTRFCDETRASDLSCERWPLRTAFLAAFTCSRTFDPRPLDNLARIAGNALVDPQLELDWHNRLYIDYVLVAARLDEPAVLGQYLDQSGFDGALAAVRIASLAYYLNQPALLEQSIERVSCGTEMQFIWEASFARALHSLTSGRLPDLPGLCRILKASDSSMVPFFALDFNLLLLEMQPGLKFEHAS